MAKMIEEFTDEEMFEWLSNGADVVIIVDVGSEELKKVIIQQKNADSNLSKHFFEPLGFDV